MTQVAITAEHLTKDYRIGPNQRAPYRTLREVVSQALAAPFRRRARPPVPFSALTDVSFQVREGEVVGVIGRNGAGKSTLLKIISRITEPTHGRVTLRGRVASLLEVGTGFHPELTGRENVFLNGTILGMTRAEIRRRFDEIVAFSEVERFIDTPVKHYSSGMHLRLAFAVAAQIDPEILLVDEVLAVGDAQFQKKCLAKIGEVARGGRTVLFVSHSMQAVTRLCTRVLLMEAGTLKLDGDPYEVTTKYLQGDLGTSAARRWPEPSAPGDEVVRLSSVRVLSAGHVSEVCDIRLPITIELEYHNCKSAANLLSVIALYDDAGNMLFSSADFDGDGSGARILPQGLVRAECVIPGNLLAEGTFRLLVEVSTRGPMYRIHALEADAASFRIVDTGAEGSVRSGWGRPIPGMLRPMLRWRVDSLGADSSARV